MPYKFQYIPTSGPLSGRSFEEQTELAINELGNHFDELSQEALNTAETARRNSENAQGAASEALNTANQAISQAQNADATAREARDESGAALATAQQARDTVNEAVDAAANAISQAETAQSTADEALATAQDARTTAEGAAEKAALAENMARSSLEERSGNFVIDENPVDADALISNARIYAATEIVNAPVAAPAFLEIMANSDETSATQAVWSESSPSRFLRTGLTVWGVNAGQNEFILRALPFGENGGDSGEDSGGDDGGSAALPVDGTLTIANDGAVMSAGFAPGGFTATEADALSLSGELRFILGEGFLGTVSCEGMDMVRVAEIDSGETGTVIEPVIVNAQAPSDLADFSILSAAYATDTLTLHIHAVWKDRSHATAWGGWVATQGGAGERMDSVPGAVAAGGTVTVPSYIVGTQKLSIFLDGILCNAGPAGFYLEQGVSGAASTTIKINDALVAGRELTAIVAG